jgi:hypothetical protein
MRGSRALIALVAALATLLVVPAIAEADGGVKVGWYSQQVRSSHAAIGADIHSSAARAGQARDRGATPGSTQVVVATVRTRAAGSSLPPPFPPLSKSASILRDQHPGGPGSFWYTDAAGHACQYVPNSVTPCFTLVGPGSNNGPAGVSPAAVAQSLARRVELAPGEIKTSPTSEGLTGSQAWFWLDPAPRRQSLSISLAGETVNVTADPTVEWRFGDGASQDGGPGVPYQEDVAPSDAITHVYGTRCLPGDQGHDPYVLASCGQAGYTVAALVIWRITYSAAGPVVGSGALPARTTETSTAYPVSESRAFLVSGGGQ